ncbi:hypothetical protein SAMN05660690_0638 [Geodermatophilus telluris]|uniref:DUF5667 domain-containing protein n=1 Tax=Geodermatophilus telluris TaxID=1190417 RepID=A0A1G6J3C1_9ACTN|nr:DUF5667 domain-containing protein [Geodermatophilus telluris]SDC13083.1 hypothetical protein SAMN05660690_0638 [Geodermatophilus telluris]
MSPSHDAAGSPRPASVRDREAALEARLRALAADLDDGPAPGFRAATRARLVAMAAVRPPAPAPPRGLRARLRPGRGARRSRLTAAVAGAVLAVTATGALVALSTGAGPGDALYGLKRGTEQTQLALAGDERGPTLLQLATTRLQELDGLADGGAPAPLVRDTLATMDAQTTEGAALVSTEALGARDAAPLTALADWARQQRSGLADLRAALPGDTGGAATGSIDLVGRIGARAERLRTALSCAGGPATSGRDELGPVPAPCAAPGTPEPSAPGAPATVPADPAGETPPAAPTPDPVPAAPSSGGGSGGATGSAPAPGAPTPPVGTPAPTTPAPDGGPVPPLPVPGGSGTSPSPSSTPPPVLDTPLSTCLLPPLLC